MDDEGMLPAPPCLPKAAGNEIYARYKAYLNAKAPRLASHMYHHPGLNMTYGLELEFFSSTNRYAFASRVNSCIFKQNFHGFWRKNFNALAGVPDRLPVDKKIEDNQGFDQYSSFMFDVGKSYRSPSFKGLARCDRRGTAGFRIEDDPSVTNDWQKYRGMTCWSLRANNDIPHQGTDIKGDADVYTAKFRGLRAANTNISREAPDTTCTEHTLRAGEEHGWLVEEDDVDNEYNVKFFQQNELVSPVLVNTYVYYPKFKAEEFGAGVAGHVFQDTTVEPEANMKLLPVGSLAIDNLLNHMKAHTSVLGVNGCGFHVHLCENPKIPNNLDGSISDHRKQVLTGFIKLFWLFEPLLFSFHPHFRANQTYAQNLQSIFTFHEIIEANNWNRIWNDLNRNIHYSGTDRKVKGQRYVAINTLNIDCANQHAAYQYNPGQGIQTIEVRIGHASFSSVFIQAWVHILQQIFTLAQCLVETQRILQPLQDPHYYINYIIETSGSKEGLLSSVPPYTKKQGGAAAAAAGFDDAAATAFLYNMGREVVAAPAKIQEGNWGRPTSGFFIHMGNSPEDNVAKTAILKHLIEIYYTCIGSEGALKELFKYTLYYHCQNNSWINKNELNAFDLYPVLSSVNAYFERPTVVGKTYKLEDRFNEYKPVLQGRDYLINKNKMDFLHACKTCAKNSEGEAFICKPDFAGGLHPQIPAIPRARIDPYEVWGQAYLDDYSNESALFFTRCPPDGGRDYYSKTQTELIPYKTSVGGTKHAFQHGGKRTRKSLRTPNRNTRKLNKSTMSLQASNDSSYRDDAKEKTYIPDEEEDDKYINPIANHIVFKDSETEMPPVQLYRIREGLDWIQVDKQKDGTLIAYHIDWVQNLYPQVRLTKILNTLVSRGILTVDEIMMLASEKYVDYPVFGISTKEHMLALREEVGKRFKFSDAKLGQIQSVYKEFEALPDNIHTDEFKLYGLTSSKKAMSMPKSKTKTRKIRSR